MADKSKHFKYNAQAFALKGHITLPIQAEIHALAPVELPATGGFRRAREENYRFEHFFSFDSAHTSVTGSYSEEKGEGAFFTTTTATIEGLDILGVITADKVVARVMSRHPYVDPESKKPPAVEPSFVPTGCHFDNLVIAGHPVKVKLHVGTLCELDTFSRASRDAKKRLGKAFHGHDKETIRCTLVSSIDTGGAPELKITAHDTIHIDHFGAIQFGEFVVTPAQRSVTMVKVTLGCATKGIIMADSVDGNGSPGFP